MLVWASELGPLIAYAVSVLRRSVASAEQGRKSTPARSRPTTRQERDHYPAQELTTPTLLPTTTTNSNKRKSTFLIQRKKSRTNYSPMCNAIMEMSETLQDKILVLCGIIFENTKTTTLRILYHLKLALTHLLMPAFGKAGLLPSTPLTGTATDRLGTPHLQTQTFPI